MKLIDLSDEDLYLLFDEIIEEMNRRKIEQSNKKNTSENL